MRVRASFMGRFRVRLIILSLTLLSCMATGNFIDEFYNAACIDHAAIQKDSEDALDIQHSRDQILETHSGIQMSTKSVKIETA